MQGIFVEYGITLDDDATEIRTADLEAQQNNQAYKNVIILRKS